MNKFLLIPLLFLLPFHFSLKAAEINIGDRLAYAEYYRAEQVLFTSPCSIEKDFFLKTEQLNQDQKLLIKEALSSLSPLLPSKILIPLLCFRYIEKDLVLSSRVLIFWMTYKLMILRDYLDAPDTPQKDLLSATRFLRTISEDESLNTSRIFEMTQGQLKELGTIISNIQNDKAYIRAIFDTPLLANNFKQSLPNVPLKIVSPLGYIYGNSSEFLDESSSKLHFGIKNRTQKLPLFYEIPSRLNQEGHPTFMQSQIMRKLKNTLDLSKESLYINLNSVDGNLGASILNYIIKNTLAKLELNSNYKVLLNHNLGLEAPLYHFLLKRLESDHKLKNAFKLMSNSPASSNTFIADIGSKKPFALSLSFPLSDTLLTQFIPLQAVYLRGPIVAALYFNFSTEQAPLVEDEWSKKISGLPTHYPSAGQEIITTHLNHSEKNIDELSSAQVAEIFKGAQLSSFGLNNPSSELLEALIAKKKISKKSQTILFINKNQIMQGVPSKYLASFDEMKKVGVQILSQNEEQKFLQLNIFSNQSLIFLNAHDAEHLNSWFVPIHFFKSPLISKISQELKKTYNNKKTVSAINLQQLDYINEKNNHKDYKGALKDSLLQTKMKEILDQL